MLPLAKVRNLLNGGSSQEKLVVQRLFWGMLAGCIVAIVLAESSWLKMMELSSLEWRYKVASRVGAAGTSFCRDIAVVAFDDTSQFDLGIARFSDVKAQDILARVVDSAEKGQPALVALDLDLRGASSPNLVSSFKKFGNIVVALFGSLDGGQALPSGELLGHSAAYGYSELVKEDNGMVCRLPINYQAKTQKIGNKEFMPVKSLTEAVIDMFRRFQGVGPASEFLPLQSDQPLYINFKSPTYSVISMRDLLQPGYDASQLKNKIVLIGSTLTPRVGDPQNFRTPIKDNVPAVMIQGDALACLLNNQVVCSLPRWLNHLLLVLMGVGFGALFSLTSTGKRLFYYLVAAVGVVLLAQVAFQLFNISLLMAAPLAVLTAVFIISTFIYLDTDLRMRNFELAVARKSMQVRAEEERRRIAEDLHDETLPTLSTVARMADKLSKEIPENTVPYMMREKLDAAVSEMRRVINDLHPSVIETMGFVPALENLLTMLERDTGIECTFNDKVSQGEFELSDFAKLQLYRIVQEAVNNIEKHSNATKAEVSIEKNDQQLSISVIDNGRGFDPGTKRKQSYGLVNIRQRAQLIGAHVDWATPSKFSSGTELIIQLPQASPVI
ncbi:MAG: CHASE2 domain-containing protein [Candidatus Obscuribacterales bacterium]|nr:CHASE2 domain-containing protein [Candidatus Obscuribacterales bacterium]